MLYSEPMRTPHIELREITVRFGSLLALDQVSLQVPPGSRVAIVGENGAGKSTLMKVLFGLLSPDAGQVYQDGLPCRFSSPREAIQAGIGMVQQHFDLIGSFTAVENIILGREPLQGAVLDRVAARQEVSQLALQNGLEIAPEQRVDELSVAAQQRVEILKALYRKARVLILDEPAAMLAPREARELWAATRRLSEAGTSVIFITHKLDEVMAHSDLVTVLRRGKRVLTHNTKETNPGELTAAMVGAALVQNRTTPLVATTSEEPAAELHLANLTIRDNRGVRAIEDFSLTVAPGEIVGLAGVDGSGQAELVEALIGLRPLEHGEIRSGNAKLEGLSIAQRRALGVAFIPEDRHRYAVALRFSLAENSVLGRHQERRFCSKRGWLNKGARNQFLAECVSTFDIRGGENPQAPLSSLSGGNQQKLVLARELSKKPKVIIAAQPTRGLDFSATAFIHSQLRQAAQEGAAVLVQSLDLNEVLLLSDRVAVLLKGRLVGVLSRAEATETTVGALMTGGTP